MVSFDDIPLYPRAYWEIDVQWRDLEQQLQHYLEDESLPLNLNPDYQRAHVWNPLQQQRYVEYVLSGGENGKTLVFNCPGWPIGPGPFELLDGKQRLRAVRLFLDNKLQAFGHYRNEYTGYMRFYLGFKFRMLALPDRAAVLRYYLAMNGGGTPHSPEELDRVRALLEKETSSEQTPAKEEVRPRVLPEGAARDGHTQRGAGSKRVRGNRSRLRKP